MKGRYQDQMKARELRMQGYTIKEICEIVKAGKGSVSGWVHNTSVLPEHIQRLKSKKQEYRNSSRLDKGREAWSKICSDRREIWRQEGRNAALKGEIQHAMACSLYWAEGAKKRNRFIFSNSDQGMISLIVKFLVDYFKIKNTDLRVMVAFYENGSLQIKDAEAYWEAAMGIGMITWQKHNVNPYNKNKIPETERKYHVNKLPFGVCSITVQRSTRIVQHIYGALEIYSQGKSVLDPFRH